MTGQDLIDEFEAAWDEVVRGNVLFRYEAEKRYAAELWLREREEARRRVLTTDEIYIARSSKDAAWSAAEPLARQLKARDLQTSWQRLPWRSPSDPSSSRWCGGNTLAVSARATAAGCARRQDAFGLRSVIADGLGLPERAGFLARSLRASSCPPPTGMGPSDLQASDPMARVAYAGWSAVSIYGM